MQMSIELPTFFIIDRKIYTVAGFALLPGLNGCLKIGALHTTGNTLPHALAWSILYSMQ